MKTTQTIPQSERTAIGAELYMSFELADKKWKLSLSDGRRGPSRYTVDAGDTVAVLECLTKARTRCGLGAQCKVHSCYEAGRDGWWLHRWLIEKGIDNIVVDAASIEVNRRARRAKTDRLDGDKLLAMLLRHHAGERVWSVLREPSTEAEDARRTHRELGRLMHERIAHTNRISSLLVLHNLRAHIIIDGRDWSAWWEHHGTQVPPLLRAEIERESARLKLVKEQIKVLEAGRRQEIEDGKQPLVAQLIQLRAIGPKGAWMLVKEIFGWREFANRRELAGCVGLAPTPYASGDSEIEQGISKAGNRRVRAMLVEQAWKWLQLQPDSALTLARRLVIALWRYLEHGEIPQGAVLKPAAA
jgi:transposase